MLCSSPKVQNVHRDGGRLAVYVWHDTGIYDVHDFMSVMTER